MKILSRMLAALAPAALVLALVAPATAPAQQRSLVVSTFAIQQDATRRNLYAPFEAQCGCRVVTDLGNSAERLAKLEARRASPEVDVAVLSDVNAAEAAQKGLIEPIDPAALSNFARLHDFAKDPVGGGFGVGYTFYSTSVVYRTDKLPQLASWKDLWSPALKGRLALPNITTTQGPLLLFMADRVHGGTSPDFQVGLAKVAEIKDSTVVFYERSAQLTQLFQQEEIWAAVTGRFNWPNIRKLDLPLGWAQLAEGQTGGINVLTLVKGARNRDLALRFIDAWLSTEVQTRMAMDLVDSPTNKEVRLPPAIAEQLSYGEDIARAIRLIPPAEALANQRAWVAGWNARIAR